MLGQRNQDREEKKRLCPSCRMEISVLAVKCMYCGEKVGRPKDEQRNLTVDDLGGESGARYAPSSSVMEALESFRVEETLDSDPDEDRVGSHPSDPGGEQGAEDAGDVGSGLPELDERSKALASVALPSQGATNIYKKKPSGASSWKQKLTYAGGAVVGLLVLYIVVTQVMVWLSNPDAPPTVRNVVPPNPAEAMLEENAPPLEIVKAAAKALDEHDIPRNRSIAEDARARLLKHVQGLLNADPFEQENLSEASRIMEEAIRYDSNHQVTQLKTEVERDSQAYVMAMRFEGDTAKLTTVVNGKNRLTTVQEGDDVGMNGRFKVYRITKSSIRLRDTLRGDRNVEVTATGDVQDW